MKVLSAHFHLESIKSLDLSYLSVECIWYYVAQDMSLALQSKANAFRRTIPSAGIPLHSMYTSTILIVSLCLAHNFWLNEDEFNFSRGNKEGLDHKALIPHWRQLGVLCSVTLLLIDWTANSLCLTVAPRTEHCLEIAGYIQVMSPR